MTEDFSVSLPTKLFSGPNQHSRYNFAHEPWNFSSMLYMSLKQPHSTTCHICPKAFIEISPCFSSYCNVSSVGQADLFRKWSHFHRRKSCHLLLETSIMLISQELTKLPAFLFHPEHHSLCRSMLIGLKI